MKKSIKICSAVIVIALLACSLMACGKSGSTGGNQGSAANEATTVEKKASNSEGYEITASKVDVWTNSIGSTWFQALVEVTNTGDVDLYIGS